MSPRATEKRGVRARHRLRGWVALLAMAGGLTGVAFACNGVDKPPSGHERQARSQVLRDLIASREKMPEPKALQSQRKDLQAQVSPGEAPEQSTAVSPQPAASTLGQVEWVGDDELLIRDPGGEERDIRIQDDTRFSKAGREVSRHEVEQGAEVRVAYDVAQNEWVAREVELLRKSEHPQSAETEGTLSQPVQR